MVLVLGFLLVSGGVAFGGVGVVGWLGVGWVAGWLVGIRWLGQWVAGGCWHGWLGDWVGGCLQARAGSAAPTTDNSAETSQDAQEGPIKAPPRPLALRPLSDPLVGLPTQPDITCRVGPPGSGMHFVRTETKWAPS